MRRSLPLIVAFVSLALLAVPAAVRPAAVAAAGHAGPAAGRLYFVAAGAGSLSATAGPALYRLDFPGQPAETGWHVRLPDATRDVSGAAGRSGPGLPAPDSDGVRLYPAPGSGRTLAGTPATYLAIVQPAPDRPAPEISIVDASTGREVLWQAALGTLSPLGRFAGWHPDGRHVLYSDWYDRTGLWLLELEGTRGPGRLSDRVADAAAFSPDGSRLAFAGRDPGATLWLAEADGSRPRAVLALPGDTSIFDLSWSPDGSRLAFVVGGAEVWLADRDGGNLRRVAVDYASGWGFAPPAWSPDGAQLAFNALAEPVAGGEDGAYTEAGAFRHAAIRVVDVASGSERWLLPPGQDPTGSLHPAWSPDGRWLAFVSDRGGQRQVWMSRPDGADLQQVTAGDGPQGALAWAPAAQPAARPAVEAAASPDSAAAAGPAAGQAPFLTTPYYGTRSITSYFDHRYPTYTAAPNGGYNRVVRYDGADLPDCGKVSSGQCIWYDGHDGIDFGLYYEPVRAAAGGLVTWAGWQNPDCQNGPACGYGLWVAVDHGNGYSTRYGHLTAIAVAKGESVRAGQIIGNSGNTGSSSGPHLHFSVHKSGKAVDPFGWTGAAPDPWAEYTGVASLPLWADGQWTGQPVPPPQTEETVIVDDGDAAYREGCLGQACAAWQVVSGVGTNGDMRWTPVKPAVANWAEWSPALVPGSYDVYAYVSGSNGTSRQAVITFTVPAGSRRALVDQYTLTNRWISLGEYEVFAGVMPLARITDATGETDTSRQIAIDAVKFVRRKSAYPYRAYLPAALRRWPPLPDIPLLAPIVAPGARGSYTLTWNAASLAASYVLQEASDLDFTQPTQVYAGTGTSFVVSSRGAATYYYRVRAANQWGNTSWSGAQAVDVSWESEPNNTSAQANGPLRPDTDYYGYPQDAGDYFRLDVPVTGTLGITLTGHSGGGVQLSLYDVAGVRLLRDQAAPYSLAYSAQPGSYYVYIYTGWGYSKTEAFTLRASFPTGEVLPAQPVSARFALDQGPGAGRGGNGEPAAN